MKDLLKKLNKVKIGEKIKATIRHCNPKLKLPDETIILELGEDCWYIEDSHDELSWNWDIIDFEKLPD